MKELKRLVLEAKPVYGYLTIIGILSIVDNVLWMTTPWLYRELVDFLTTHQLSELFTRIIPTVAPFWVLVWLVGIYSVLDLMATIANEIQWYFIAVTGTRAWAFYMAKTMHKLLVKHRDAKVR